MVLITRRLRTLFEISLVLLFLQCHVIELSAADVSTETPLEVTTKKSGFFSGFKSFFGSSKTTTTEVPLVISAPYTTPKSVDAPNLPVQTPVKPQQLPAKPPAQNVPFGSGYPSNPPNGPASSNPWLGLSQPGMPQPGKYPSTAKPSGSPSSSNPWIGFNQPVTTPKLAPLAPSSTTQSTPILPPSLPNKPNTPMAQPSPSLAANNPMVQPSQPIKPPTPVVQPNQPLAPNNPMLQPSQPMKPNTPIPSQPLAPNSPIQPYQPNPAAQPSQPIRPPTTITTSIRSSTTTTTTTKAPKITEDFPALPSPKKPYVKEDFPALPSRPTSGSASTQPPPPAVWSTQKPGANTPTNRVAFVPHAPGSATPASADSKSLASDDELATLTETLYQKENSQLKYLTLDLQGKTRSSETGDEAPNPFLRVQDQALQSPTIAKMRLLFNNYELDTMINEYVTPIERKEENEFLDLVMATPVMRQAMLFLQSKGVVTPDPKTHRDLVKTLWFTLFSRGNGKIGSSGFEHVFLSEVRNGTVLGLHNWVYYNDEEVAGNIDYKGYIKKVDLGNKATIVKFRSTHNGLNKPVNSLIIGSSPELELALYTVCFEVRQSKECPVSLGGSKFSITTHPWKYRGKTLIGSSYIEI